MLTLAGCGEKPQKPLKEDSKEKISEHLEKIDGENEKLIEEVEKIKKEREKPVIMLEDEKSSNSKNEEEKGDEEKKEKDDTIKTEDKILKRDKAVYTMWENTLKKVELIHQEWNSYEQEAIEKGASSDDILAFERAIDGLALAVDNKDIFKTLIKANEATYNLARFFDFYKGNIDGEISRIKYYARQIYLASALNQTLDMDGMLKNISDALDRLRQKVRLEEKDKDVIIKLHSSIQDMLKTFQYKNTELLRIKKDIVLENAKEVLEKARK